MAGTPGDWKPKDTFDFSQFGIGTQQAEESPAGPVPGELPGSADPENASTAVTYVKGALGVLPGSDELVVVSLLDGDNRSFWVASPHDPSQFRVLLEPPDATWDEESACRLRLGGAGERGLLVLHDIQGTEKTEISDHGLRLLDPEGEVKASLTEGGLAIAVPGSTDSLRLTEGGLVLLHSGQPRAALDKDGSSAQLTLFDHHDNPRVALKANTGDVTASRVKLSDANGQEGVVVNGHNRTVKLNDSSGATTIRLDGDKGDISLIGADCAELMSTAGAEIPPGAVVSATAGGAVARSAEAYDRKVVGVVSGLGALKPGILLNKAASAQAHVPVAVAGRVYCAADARPGPIEVGDLLTTSDEAGVAMKAADRDRAFGSVFGKALSSLPAGKGEVLVLVSLR